MGAMAFWEKECSNVRGFGFAAGDGRDCALENCWYYSIERMEATAEDALPTKRKKPQCIFVQSISLCLAFTVDARDVHCGGSRSFDDTLLIMKRIKISTLISLHSTMMPLTGSLHLTTASSISSLESLVNLQISIDHLSCNCRQLSLNFTACGNS